MVDTGGTTGINNHTAGFDEKEKVKTHPLFLYNMSSGICVAFVGTGGVANGHARTYKQIPDSKAKIAIVCDIDEETGKKFQNKYDVPKYVKDYGDIISDNSIDMVDICTPPEVKKDQVVKALQNSKHVMVEKPPAKNIEEMKEIRDTYKKVGGSVKFCTMHNHRFDPYVLDAKKLIEEGEIGDVVGVDILFMNQPETDGFVQNADSWAHNMAGGKWHELMPHYLYIASDFLGDLQLDNVEGRGKLEEYPWLISTDAYVTLSKKDGVGFANLKFSQRSEVGKQKVMTVYGTKGHIQMESFKSHIKSNNTYNLQSNRGKVSGLRSYLWPSNQLDLLTRIKQKLWKVTNEEQDLGHEVLIKKYVDAILTDSDSPVSFKEAYNTMKLTDEVGEKLGQKTEDLSVY